MTTYHDRTGQTCTVCTRPGEQDCEAENLDWVCTRRKGHDGAHIARTPDAHSVAHWPQEFRDTAHESTAPPTPVCCGPQDEGTKFWHERWHEAADQRDAAKAMANLWKETARENVRRFNSAMSAYDQVRVNEFAAVTRAGKAEQERDHLRKVLDTTARQRDNAMRNDRPRPLTPADITDEMVDRAHRSLIENLGFGRVSRPEVRESLAAALTEPPARPEGAEEVENAVKDYLRARLTLPADEAEPLADFLAERGVRVVKEES